MATTVGDVLELVAVAPKGSIAPVVTPTVYLCLQMNMLNVSNLPRRFFHYHQGHSKICTPKLVTSYVNMFGQQNLRYGV